MQQPSSPRLHVGLHHPPVGAVDEEQHQNEAVDGEDVVGEQ